MLTAGLVLTAKLMELLRSSIWKGWPTVVLEPAVLVAATGWLDRFPSIDGFWQLFVLLPKLMSSGTSKCLTTTNTNTGWRGGRELAIWSCCLAWTLGRVVSVV